MKLFLDDIRIPLDCIGYMHSRIGKENPIYLDKDWVVVKDYKQFVKYFQNNPMPEIISFDHDLAEEHYMYDEFDAPGEKYEFETGYDCLIWLVEHCKKNDLGIPRCIFHTMNPVGRERMDLYYRANKK